ncbi:hypothetical protein [Pseudoalteromonas spongiae]|uniref:hypothetical protein n=1 Tax=Pseudoalteromonas spongiae TaxID=298657 RepID=UPI001BB1D247|nr:hypothetical protein [Pseudoalteromonas spongiae]
MSEQQKIEVQFVDIDEGNHGQRIVNFLIAALKGVRKSAIFGFLRNVEVGVYIVGSSAVDMRRACD